MAQFPAPGGASGIWSLTDANRATQGSNWPIYSPPVLEVEYLVIAGGGGGAGGSAAGGGGGAAQNGSTPGTHPAGVVSGAGGSGIVVIKITG